MKNKFQIAPLDREVVQEFLNSSEHHLQCGLRWFDFIQEYSGETDRSVMINRNGNPVAFVLALQHKNLIQSLPYPASYAGLQFMKKLTNEEIPNLVEALGEYFSQFADVFSVCTPPLTDADTDLCREFDFSSRSRIHYIDLRQPSMTGTTSKFRNNLRRNLRKAQDAGVMISEAGADQTLSEWHECYSKRMKELGGAILDLEFFTAMRNHFAPKRNFKLFIARIGQRLIGGTIVVYNQFCADYYLSVVDREWDDSQANTALFDHLLSWAKDAGIRYLNLQGSPSSQQGLIEFKRSWGAIEGEHQYLVKLLGNREDILRQSADRIKRNYPFHYLVPFDELSEVSSASNEELASVDIEETILST